MRRQNDSMSSQQTLPVKQRVQSERSPRLLERSLDAPSHAAFRMAVFSNIWFGLAETIMFLTMALAFWYGSTLVREGQYTLTQMFTVFIAMIFGSQSAGQVFS